MVVMLSFAQLYSIQLHEYTTICSSILQLMDIWVIYRLCFVAIMNNSAVNIL